MTIEFSILGISGLLHKRILCPCTPQNEQQTLFTLFTLFSFTSLTSIFSFILLSFILLSFTSLSFTLLSFTSLTLLTSLSFTLLFSLIGCSTFVGSKQTLYISGVNGKYEKVYVNGISQPIPSSFEFNGRIIITTNMPTHDNHGEIASHSANVTPRIAVIIDLDQ